MEYTFKLLILRRRSRFKTSTDPSCDPNILLIIAGDPRRSVVRITAAGKPSFTKRPLAIGSLS